MRGNPRGEGGWMHTEPMISVATASAVSASNGPSGIDQSNKRQQLINSKVSTTTSKPAFARTVDTFGDYPKTHNRDSLAVLPIRGVFTITANEKNHHLHEDMQRRNHHDAVATSVNRSKGERQY